MRTIEYWDFDLNEWFDIEWETVVSGMVIHMYEENGDPISEGTGVYEMNVVSDAYQQTISGVGDVWTVDIADPDPSPVPRRAE